MKRPAIDQRLGRSIYLCLQRRRRQLRATHEPAADASLEGGGVEGEAGGLLGEQRVEVVDGL